jgi:hypothetical protein
VPISTAEYSLGMAEESGVTEAGLKAKIIERLQATHVDIEDMSGTLPNFYPVMLEDNDKL